MRQIWRRKGRRKWCKHSTHIWNSQKLKYFKTIDYSVNVMMLHISVTVCHWYVCSGIYILSGCTLLHYTTWLAAHFCITLLGSHSWVFFLKTSSKVSYTSCQGGQAPIFSYFPWRLSLLFLPTLLLENLLQHMED